jgi:integrase
MASIQKRTAKDGSTSYRVLVRLKGYPPQSATFPRRTDAKRWAQDTESAIREGRHFKTAEAKRHTLADLIDRYIRDVLPRPPRKSRQKERGAKSQQILKAQLEWWKSELGHYTLADVTPANIVECRDRLANTPTSRGRPRSPATVVRYMAPLSHAFGVAVREWGWLDDSPMRKVERPSEPEGRKRFLSEEERDILLSACRDSSEPWLYPIVVLTLSTGMRRGEVMSLRWPQVDLQQGRIILFRTKNNETRVLPLTGPALVLLKEHSKIRRMDTDLLWPSKRKPDVPMEMREAWKRAVKKTGLADFRFHDLRHTAASYLVMNGASLAEAAEVLGHKTLAMVQRYAHLSEAHTAGVVERMNERFLGGA